MTALIYSICYCLVSCTPHPSHGQTHCNSRHCRAQQHLGQYWTEMQRTLLHWNELQPSRLHLSSPRVPRMGPQWCSGLSTITQPSQPVTEIQKKWTQKWMGSVQRKPEKARRMCLGISRLASNHKLCGFYSCALSEWSSWCKPSRKPCTCTSLLHDLPPCVASCLTFPNCCSHTWGSRAPFHCALVQCVSSEYGSFQTWFHIPCNELPHWNALAVCVLLVSTFLWQCMSNPQLHIWTWRPYVCFQCVCSKCWLWWSLFHNEHTWTYFVCASQSSVF